MNRVLLVAAAALLFSIAASAQSASPSAASCGRLDEISLPSAKVTSAQVIPAGAFTPPPLPHFDGEGPDPIFKSLPAFCRVQITATPSTDSDIRIEVWLPAENWNRRLQGVGNGGFAGSIPYHGLAEAIRQGYAAVATDTGHSASDITAAWALGHPEKITDFGFRAIHVMTTLGKSATTTYFGSAPQHSYFAACSNGGRQALLEAQRYPEDYDGIIAGAPANYWSHLLTSAVADAQTTTKDPASYIPAEKIPAIADAVNAACDASDGVKDGILNDPRKCRFDPAVLLCKGADSSRCLTAPQAQTLKKLYQGARDSRGVQIFPGRLPGAEGGPGGWGLWVTGPERGKALLFYFGNGFFANMVFGKPDFDADSANLDEVLKAAGAMASTFDATDPNLSAFRARGGKLILYHGWNDAAISALNTIAYFQSVGAAMGEQNRDTFLRLYMVPGMQHCAGGPGADFFGQFGPSPLRDAQHSAQVALEQWVENGMAPDSIIATHFPGDDPAKPATMTRPICPYPQSAKYKGSGDTNSASSFVCSAP